MPTQPPNDPAPVPLDLWKINPSRNPNFRAEVWARIEAASRPSTWVRFARLHPAIITGGFAVALLIGAWTGATEARERANADRSVIVANYVHSLDARWMGRP